MQNVHGCCDLNTIFCNKLCKKCKIILYLKYNFNLSKKIHFFYQDKPFFYRYTKAIKIEQ